MSTSEIRPSSRSTRADSAKILAGESKWSAASIETTLSAALSPSGVAVALALRNSMRECNHARRVSALAVSICAVDRFNPMTLCASTC